MKKLYLLWSGKSFGQLKKGLLTLLLIGIYSSFFGQSSAYSFTQSNGTFTPVTGTVLGTATGNTTTTNLNSAVFVAPIPFNFNYNGIVYTTLSVSSNGFITFGATPPATATTTPISGTVAYDGAVSAFGRDLSGVFDVNGVTSSISYETVGTAPNRELVIQWSNFRPASSTSTTNVYTTSFQIRLAETAHVISVVYGNSAYTVGSTAVSGTAQVGLRGLTNADFNNRLNATSVEFNNSAAGTANSSSQAFHSINAVPGMPAAGLTYSWTPPSCFAPVGLGTAAVTTSGAEIDWDPSPVSGVTYDVYYNTTGTPPTLSTTPNITGLTATTASLGGLSPASMYYVWVRINCGGSQSAWSLVTFTTLCDILTGSYFENFDGYTGTTNGTAGILPNCWTNLGTTNGGHISSSTSPTGSNTLYLWTSGTRIAYVALPPMNTLQSGTYKLSFDAFASVTAGGILQVGYQDTTGNFVELTTFTVPTTNTVYPFTYNLPPLPTGVTQLVLRNPGTPANSLSIDNVAYQPQSLSTAEVKQNNLKLYPNPFVDVLYISDVANVKMATVRDLSGRVVRTVDKLERGLSLGDLLPGMYLVTLQMKDGSTHSYKTIKK